MHAASSRLSSSETMTPIMAQYHALKSQYKEQLLFFRLGDFYELFFEDAKIAAKELDIVLTQRQKKSDHPIPMCGVPVHASESYIARLIKKGLHVAICEQVETPSQKKGIIKREVVRIITPGTLVEDPLLNAKEHNFLLAVYPSSTEQELGLSWMDISTGDFFIETYGISQLSAVLCRLCPKEILIPVSIMESAFIQNIWLEWKNKITAQPLSRFDQPHRRIQEFFNVQTVDSFGQFTAHEIAAAGALLEYALITQKRDALMLSRPKKIDKTHFLEMDAFTRKNLEIQQTFSGDKKGSLLHTMDRTVTPMGARLLRTRLMHPIKDAEQIKERLDSVDFFVQRSNACMHMRDTLNLLPDVERALTRLILRRGTPRDMDTVRKALNTFPIVQASLEHASPTLPTELKQALGALKDHQSLSDLLNRALSDNIPTLLRDGHVIARGYHKKLDQLRHTKDHTEETIQSLQKQYIQETSISHLKIKHNNILGHYIEISAAQAGKVPFHFSLKQSLVSGHRYTTAELSDIDKRSVFAQDEICALEAELFDDLVDKIVLRCEQIRHSIRGISVLDVSSALGQLALDHNFCKPIIDTSIHLNIVQGRHPVVESCTQGPFVANDCLLSQGVPIWLMTGPNMSGKSTFLRQNAHIVLMAHMGSFVPAQSAHIGTVDRIFSRLGAGDELAQNRSTFMVEMIETSTILNQATEKSFVIFDEVGRGTSTYDGLAIACACLEYIADHIQCRTLFSTHYHELSCLENNPAISCHTMHVKKWNNQIIFLHKVIPGTSNGSYGLHVARLSGMPEKVLCRAENILHCFERNKIKINHHFDQHILTHQTGHTS